MKSCWRPSRHMLRLLLLSVKIMTIVKMVAFFYYLGTITIHMGTIKEKYARLLEKVRNSDGPVVFINGCTHGHERIGARIVKELEKITAQRGVIITNIANERAYDLGVPFTESDLNRSFPGDPEGAYEEVLAYYINPIVKEADIVIDIHSTETTCAGHDSAVILTKLDVPTLEIIEMIQPPRVLIMKHTEHNALISGAKIGLGFEYGKDKDESTFKHVLNDIKKILKSLNIIAHENYNNEQTNADSLNTEFYEVTDTVKKPEGFILSDEVNNFTHIEKDTVLAKKGEESIIAEDDFYPILFGRNRYKDIFGFKGFKIDDPRRYITQG